MRLFVAALALLGQYKTPVSDMSPPSAFRRWTSTRYYLPHAIALSQDVILSAQFVRRAGPVLQVSW